MQALEAAPPPSLRLEIRRTLYLALPLMGAQVFSMSMVVVDNIVVGRLGSVPLAAMAVSTTLYNVCIIVAIGILASVGPLVSSAVGAGRADTVGRTVFRACLVSLVLAAGMIGVLTCAGPILRLLGQNPGLFPMATGFLRSASWGVPAAMGYLALRQFTEGVLDTRPSIVISVVVACLNPFLDVGLVLGHFGFPRLEMPGAGVALSVANWLMLLLMLGYLRFHPRYQVYRFWRDRHPKGHTVAEILKLGLPMGGTLLSEMSFFATATMLMGTLGTLPLAAHQIAINACSFAFMIPLGLSFAAALRLGDAMGRGDRAGVQAAGRAATWMVLGTQCLSGICFLVGAPWIVRLYSQDPTVLVLATTLLRIGGVFQMFDGLQVVGNGMLRGVLDTRVPFLAAFSAYWLVGLPLGWFLAFRRHDGPVGLWCGLVVGLGVAAGLHQWRFRVVTRCP